MSTSFAPASTGGVEVSGPASRMGHTWSNDQPDAVHAYAAAHEGSSQARPRSSGQPPSGTFVHVLGVSWVEHATATSAQQTESHCIKTDSFGRVI